MCGVSWTQRHITAAGVYNDGSDCVYSVVERLSVSAESTESHIDSGGWAHPEPRRTNVVEEEHPGEHRHLVDLFILQ